MKMPDSVRPLEMPRGYPAYLAYLDGARSRDADQVRALFPRAHILTLTVLGGDAVADGCDREPGDLSAATAAAWVQRRLRMGAWRPVVYASVSSMQPVLTTLASLGIGRRVVRLLTAHYGAGEHVCGPGTCGQLAVAADGTQWTNQAAGVNGARIDMSLLRDDFFGAATVAPSPTAEVNVQFPVLRQGAAGQAVRNWQGLLVSHACGYLIAPGRLASGMSEEERAGVDGDFGPKTEAATRKFQEAHGLAVDGIVGPRTWERALTVS